MEKKLEIKRELDTSNAVYSISGLSRPQFSILYRGYLEYIYRACQCTPEDDELLKKLQKMADSDITII